MEAGKVNILTAILDQGCLGPGGMWSVICKMHVTHSVAASREFWGGKKKIIKNKFIRSLKKTLKEDAILKTWAQLEMNYFRDWKSATPALSLDLKEKSTAHWLG